MVNNVKDKVNNMFTSIGAMQTLIENFPMSLFSFGDLKFSTSFDIIAILFKILGVDREEFIEMLTELICGNDNSGEDGGFIDMIEIAVKGVIETNISGLLNCSINPIISDKLLDGYKNSLGVEKEGDGIELNVSEIDFTGVLNKNPFHETDKKFYFDVDGKNANNLYTSRDFNAYLWYIINRSGGSDDENRIWTDKNSSDSKEIIKCTYIDNDYSNQDRIKVQICSSSYYRTRKITDNVNINKTILEFNHDFLKSVKLYDKKVILAEIIEYFFGPGNISLNLGVSMDEQIIQGQIQKIISKIIEIDDMEVNDCYFSFDNDEYNEMLEKYELNRYNIINGGDDYYEVNTSDILSNLDGMNSNSVFIDDKTTIKKTVNDIIEVTAAKDPSSEVSFKVEYDWEFELIRMLAYPFIRPLFTPKVIFLFLVNKNIMGSFNNINDLETILNNLMGSLFNVLRNAILKIKDSIVDMMLSYILKKLKPLLSLFASRLLMESLKAYKDLLENILENCKIPNFGNQLIGNIDNVNYADIIQTQTVPNENIC